MPLDLIEAAKRGDARAFEDLVRSTHRAVYTLAYRIVGNPDDAADVVQEVYIRAWRGLRNFRGDANAGTWLHRIAANTALTHLRRKTRGGIPIEPSELPDLPTSDGTEASADADALERALTRLPVSQRAVVVLKDVYGWSCREIAKELRTTEGAVKVRLFRARQRLADELVSEGVVIPMSKRKKRTS